MRVAYTPERAEIFNKQQNGCNVNPLFDVQKISKHDYFNPGSLKFPPNCRNWEECEPVYAEQQAFLKMIKTLEKKYENIAKEMLLYFSEKVAQARSFGINDLIIDPGFGFAKTTEQNFEVMNNMELFQILELPMLVGVSRKSMIYKTLETEPDFALNGTTVLNTIALQKGAKILRVHDVKEAIETIKLVGKL